MYPFAFGAWLALRASVHHSDADLTLRKKKSITRTHHRVRRISLCVCAGLAEARKLKISASKTHTTLICEQNSSHVRFHLLNFHTFTHFTKRKTSWFVVEIILGMKLDSLLLFAYSVYRSAGTLKAFSMRANFCTRHFRFLSTKKSFIWISNPPGVPLFLDIHGSTANTSIWTTETPKRLRRPCCCPLEQGAPPLALLKTLLEERWLASIFPSHLFINTPSLSSTLNYSQQLPTYIFHRQFPRNKQACHVRQSHCHQHPTRHGKLRQNGY